MKLAAVVVLLAVVGVAWAADADSEGETVSVSADFVSSSGMTKARIVQNVKVFLDPASAIPAKIVKRLPSHDSNAEEEEEQSEQIHGDAFETTNVVADAAPEGESMRFAQRSAPIAKLKAKLERAAPDGVVPDGLMLATPPGTPTDANVDPLSPAALNAQGPAQPQVMDAAAVRASHLYIGYEDPNHLPDGTEIKKPVDLSGTVGTEAGNDFDFSKKQDPNKKCSNGCQVKLPVMVGYPGLREEPAEGTRRVIMPGDRSKWRMIHSEYKIPARHTWHPVEIKAGHKHLRRASYKIDRLRQKRKAYEDTALNREVRVNPSIPPSGLVNAP